MKKIFALLLALALCLCAVSAAAEESYSINFEDYSARIEEYGLSGDFVTLDDAAVSFWLPDTLKPVELTDEDIAGGLIAFYSADEGYMLSVVSVDANGMDLNAYIESLSGMESVVEIDSVLLNGSECALYLVNMLNNEVMQQNGCIAFITEAGNVLEFAFGPVGDSADITNLLELMASSIQFAE